MHRTTPSLLHIVAFAGVDILQSIFDSQLSSLHYRPRKILPLCLPAVSDTFHSCLAFTTAHYLQALEASTLGDLCKLGQLVTTLGNRSCLRGTSTSKPSTSTVTPKQTLFYPKPCGSYCWLSTGWSLSPVACRPLQDVHLLSQVPQASESSYLPLPLTRTSQSQASFDLSLSLSVGTAEENVGIWRVATPPETTETRGTEDARGAHFGTGTVVLALLRDASTTCHERAQ